MQGNGPNENSNKQTELMHLMANQNKKPMLLVPNFIASSAFC